MKIGYVDKNNRPVIADRSSDFVPRQGDYVCINNNICPENINEIAENPENYAEVAAVLVYPQFGDLVIVKLDCEMP